MSYCVLVEFEIHEEAVARFLPLIRMQAANSLAKEAGCKVFDVWTASQTPCKVVLYEIYSDRAAFDLHLASAHFQSFESAVAEMVASKRVSLLDQQLGVPA